MIHKLKYNTKEKAFKDLVKKKVINKSNNYINGTQSVVYVGKIIDTPAEYDTNGNVTKEATYLKGFHVDVMTNDTIDFGDNEVKGVNSPAHKFK